VSITSSCSLDAAELIGEQVPVKGTLPDAGSHYCRVVDPSKLQVCPSPVALSSFWNLRSPFFFLFLNSNRQGYRPIF
jgi:hypothetical protein